MIHEIEEEGEKSTVIREAIEEHFKHGKTDKTSAIPEIEDMFEEIKGSLEEIKRFQPTINITYPRELLPKPKPKKKWRLWRRGD